MYYHASQTQGIKTLMPHVSNHGVPLIYFSSKRENVLVYLSNAVEKYCREIGFAYTGRCQKWASYGFSKDGRQDIQEYYPDAVEKTYAGVSGYIYCVRAIHKADFDIHITDSYVSDRAEEVTDVEYVPDAYEAILRAEREGLITITRYHELSDNMRRWIEETTRTEYAEAAQHPEYRHFLLGNFGELLS